MAYIYKITNTVNSKVYVGQTHNALNERWRAHKYYSKFSTAPLYRAMRKHGIDKFHIEIIEECKQSELNDREIYWIKQYNSYGNTGYNATRGGKGHWKYEEDYVRALWDAGSNLTKIHKETKICKNTIKKILGDYKPYIEQKEERYRIASSDKTYESKPVKQYSMDGEYLETYKSISEASRITGIDKSTIMRVCKRRSVYAGNYQWRYKDDTDDVGKVVKKRIAKAG